MTVIVVMLILGILAYACSEKNKIGSALGVALMVGVPLGAFADSLVSGDKPSWMLFLCAACFYAGMSLNDKK